MAGSFWLRRRGIRENMILKFAEMEDKEFVMSLDRHVSDVQYRRRILAKGGYVMWESDNPVGVLSFCVFWDNVPFLNHLCVKEECRGCGYGLEAMRLWEQNMKAQGYKMVLISTQVDESAQNFYRRIGYIDCGGLMFYDTPLDQPMEMFMRKVL